MPPFATLGMQGVLAYVILRPATSLVGFIAALCGKYGDGMLRYDRAYVYVVAINNVSQVEHMCV